MLGHEKLVNELKSLATAGRLKHAYIFFGPEGVGKKTAALELAATFENIPYESTKVLTDAMMIEPAGNSLGIDEARKVKEFLIERPLVSKFRTAIIDRGELLTEEAANSLLKIAEEPPQSALLILIATDPGQVGETLASRFEKIYFGPVPEKKIESWLLEKKFPAERAKKAAASSFGRPGLALRMLEDESFAKLSKQVSSYLNASPGEVKNLLKGMLEDEEFKLVRFLDMLILVLAAQKVKNLDLWHKTLELRDTAENFGLNSKIQLEYLHSFSN